MPKHAVNDNAEIRSRNPLATFAHPINYGVHFQTQMRTLLLIATLACFQFGCGHWNFTLKAKLHDAVQRHASIDERIMEWGDPSAKETLNDGQIVDTWKLPWSDEQLMPGGNAYSIPHACTVVITTSSDNAVQSYKTDDC